MSRAMETSFIMIVATGLAVLAAGAVASAILLDAVMGALSPLVRALWRRP